MHKRPHPVVLATLPAIITLAVTIVRLVGERSGWSSKLFATAPGGGGALVGITWLVPVFGAWFGLRLVRGGGPARPWRALFLHLLAVVVYLAGFQVAGRIDGSTHAGLILQIVAMGICAVIAGLIAWRAWPALAVVDLVYGLMARVPTAAITWFAVHGAWGTHYEKFGKNDFAEFGANEAAAWLMFTQIVFWVPFTAVVGGLFGNAVALLGRRRRVA